MPNAFTPNGDTKNDICKPSFYGNVTQYEFRIYNRYGDMVFYTKDLAKGWDGKLKGKAQNADAYVWTCIYQIEGLMLNQEQGSVMLIR